MDKEEIVKQLISMLHELQEQLGETPLDITADIRPVGGISGFSSLTGVSFTADCIERFKIPDDEKLQSLVVGEKEGNFYFKTVSEIADEISERLSKK